MNQANVHGIVLYLQEITPVSILHCARSVVSAPVGVSLPLHTLVAKPQKKSCNEAMAEFSVVKHCLQKAFAEAHLSGIRTRNLVQRLYSLLASLCFVLS